MFQTDPTNNGFVFSGSYTDAGGTQVGASVATGAAAQPPALSIGAGGISLANPVVLILLIAAIVIAFR